MQPRFLVFASALGIAASVACGDSGDDAATEPTCDGPSSESTPPNASSESAAFSDGLQLDQNAAGAARTTILAANISDVQFVHGSDFAKPLGKNGRVCEDCHRDTDGWSVTPAALRQRFEANDREPIFATNDGSNTPRADVSSHEARRAAFSMLLSRATVRVGMAMPSAADFELAGVDDPYGFASASELSLFRRPLPTTNLKFLTQVMWDGRESTACGTIETALGRQAVNATKGHAAGDGLESARRDAVVRVELALFSSQVRDFMAGGLDEDGARGGNHALLAQPFYYRMNDPRGVDPRGAHFSPKVFTLYDAWRDVPAGARNGGARRSIARGQEIFDTRTFAVTRVGGLDDDASASHVTATCSTCHNTPNVGNDSTGRFFDVGVADAARRTPDMPLYTLVSSKTGEVRRVTDPGRALVTGAFRDVGRFKGNPLTRGVLSGGLSRVRRSSSPCAVSNAAATTFA